MALVELGLAFIAAAVADLRGNEQTRPFTRMGFWSLVFVEAGLTLSGLASFGGDVLTVIGGLV